MIMHFCGVDREQNFTIRRLFEDERQAALDLAWVVFSEYESPDYSSEGTEEFRKCLHDEAYLSGLHYYGAFDGEKLIGEIAIRPEIPPPTTAILTFGAFATCFPPPLHQIDGHEGQ